MLFHLILQPFLPLAGGSLMDLDAFGYLSIMWLRVWFLLLLISGKSLRW